MEVDSDPFTTTVVGSRYPITVSAIDFVPTPSKPSLPQPSTALTPTVAIPISSIRRKPVYTYKSPAALAANEHLSITRPANRASHAKVQSSTTNGSGTAKNAHTNAETRPIHVAKPPLPLYHPQGSLALSLPELDPSLFGLPSRVTVDDTEPANELDGTRRSSSRARRPAAKVRDRDLGEDDERPGSSGTNGRASERDAARDRNGSPRKKRGTGGAAAAAKRKRKEPDDVDSGYPPPPKRTRNPRGIAGPATPPVASPLASATVVAGDADVNADAGVAPLPAQTLDGAAPEEMQVEEQPEVEAEPKRSTRPRRARAAANRRRASDASETNSSMSGSITANGNGAGNSNGNGVLKRPSRARRAEPRGQDIAPEKKEEEEPEEEAAAGHANGNGVEQTNGKPVPPEPASAPAAEESDAPKVQNGDIKMAEVKPPSLREQSPQKESPQKESPQKEEKEEGELSDEAEAFPSTIKV
ncbi:hypothetical protein OBBRIDRAFT_791901 [Obba rivulosa]|uniref:Uncharacterized protein n=1 Tax=Obba rivulosa TaxID=1052685 RepID=A0A8E2DN00_9APHY|nr:hypothetical protein OBBRIDRAFT_791901 [Obba rivulosa]